ncbi:hypothetical protein [Jiangella asiatica]|uniref:hypothetical protein n=1 Tax=Jiangella asiatica TaxID=2530372 RepID=UPI001EF0D32C|nr:hypothetical protein [Jiangella asiatica]
MSARPTPRPRYAGAQPKPPMRAVVPPPGDQADAGELVAVEVHLAEVSVEVLGTEAPLEGRPVQDDRHDVPLERPRHRLGGLVRGEGGDRPRRQRAGLGVYDGGGIGHDDDSAPRPVRGLARAAVAWPPGRQRGSWGRS